MKLDVSGADFQSVFQQLANAKTMQDIDDIAKSEEVIKKISEERKEALERLADK